MFAYVKGGTVKHITLKDAAVFIRNTGKDRIYAGALITAADSKKTNGEIDQVAVSGKISAHSNSGAIYAGGIIGQCSGGILTNSYANVEVNAKSDSAWVYAGAIEGIGAWNGVINNYAKGSVRAKAPVNKAAIGGITGFQSGALYNCWTSVDLIAESSTGDVGGVAGRNTGIGFILKCYYDADAKQMSGNLPAEEKKAVGTIVNGDDQGKGTAEELKAVEDIKNAIFAEKLNQNLADTEAIDRVKELLHLENWGAGKADTMKFLTWAVSSKGSVRLISEKELAEVEDVIEKIDAIGTVTLESKNDIENARGAYEKLSEDQKMLITNYMNLENAEAKYVQLKAEADKEAEKQDPSPSQKDDSGKDNSNSSQKDDSGKGNGNTSQKDDSGNLNHSSGTVETGDSNVVYLWIFLLAVAVIGSGVICRMRKLKK